MSRIENPIFPISQTPDACVTACLKATMYGLEMNYEELVKDLSKFKVYPQLENSEYYSPEGIMKVLSERGLYVGLHVGTKEPYQNNLIDVATLQEYNSGVFSYDTFVDYVTGHLEQKRYLFVWLDNQKYSPEGYKKNGYKQHVVVIYGVDGQQASIMDPDIYLEEEEKTRSYDLSHLFSALWRDTARPKAIEKIMVIGK
ncbi:MAG TPA: hypothetical protein VLF89_02345 [Candidatus Saccharimonadales bacterium]|nr:hypothetical protein [Candidatus Saccharimonadales bacterium]HSW96644.1 hypothetical protein [Candidatus Saccharimonadales bacterium]